MMMFAPASIQPNSLPLSPNLLLKRLMDLYSPLERSGSFTIVLLKRFIPVVEV